jgi:hypothetical protein
VEHHRKESLLFHNHNHHFTPPTTKPSTTRIMTLTKINFITGNKNKLIEVRAILGSVIEVDNQAVDVPEIQGTIEEIAKEKARRAAEAVS